MAPLDSRGNGPYFFIKKGQRLLSYHPKLIRNAIVKLSCGQVVAFNYHI